MVVPAGIGLRPSQLTSAHWSAPSVWTLPPIGADAIWMEGLSRVAWVDSGPVGSSDGSPVGSDVDDSDGVNVVPGSASSLDPPQPTNSINSTTQIGAAVRHEFMTTTPTTG
jgi:hypothetical protein